MTDATGHFELSDAVAVVTGAAGWLGGPIVEALRDAGARVYAIGRDVERLERRFGADLELITVVPCDVTTSVWPELLADIGEREGRIDVLINNAHVGRTGSMDTASPELFHEAFDIAVQAAWAGIVAATPHLRAARALGGSPSVINVASMYGLVAPDMSIYAQERDRNPPYYGAAKAALLQLTRYAASELGPEGIRVNSISPGPFPAPPALAQPDFTDELSRRTMLGRVGQPQEIQTSVLFLASRSSGFVTGSNVLVDGGWTAR